MRLDSRDLRLLRTIADYRIMTIRQIAMVQEHDFKNVHRRALDLAEMRFLAEGTRGVASRVGRPEKLVSITRKGLAALLEADSVRLDTTEQDTILSGIGIVEHQILLNWVRIQWTRIDHVCPALRTRFVPHSSPIAQRGEGVPGGGKAAPVILRSDRKDVTIPDAVATITDVERGKTVLFFIEIDMGTEPLDTIGKSRATIGQKIQKYQRYFRTGRYRDYESMCGHTIRGFRVLFVTHTSARLRSLCEFLSGHAPREFIWLTAEEQLMETGVWSHIWARGGHQDQPRESILGSRACGDTSPTAATSLPRATKEH